MVTYVIIFPSESYYNKNNLRIQKLFTGERNATYYVTTVSPQYQCTAKHNVYHSVQNIMSSILLCDKPQCTAKQGPPCYYDATTVSPQYHSVQLNIMSSMLLCDKLNATTVPSQYHHGTTVQLNMRKVTTWSRRTQ